MTKLILLNSILQEFTAGVLQGLGVGRFVFRCKNTWQCHHFFHVTQGQKDVIQERSNSTGFIKGDLFTWSIIVCLTLSCRYCFFLDNSMLSLSLKWSLSFCCVVFTFIVLFTQVIPHPV